MVIMTHQTLSLEKYWKVLPATLILLKKTLKIPNSRLKSKNHIQFENKITKIDTLLLAILFQ